MQSQDTILHLISDIVHCLHIMNDSSKDYQGRKEIIDGIQKQINHLIEENRKFIDPTDYEPNWTYYDGAPPDLIVTMSDDSYGMGQKSKNTVPDI